MDFALTTLLLLFLLLPGLIFRRFYYTEEFSKEYFKESVPNFFLSLALPSTIMNALCWQIVDPYFDFDVQVWGILLSGTDDPKYIGQALDNVHRHLADVLGYLILVCLLSAMFGWLTKKLIRKSKLDRRIKLFRFQNEWHYLFSGEILDFPRVQGQANAIDCTNVDVLVDTAEGSIIYMGMLQEYVLSKEGGIERIYLTDVKRRFLKQEKKNKVERIQLPGQFFVIPSNRILNLHLTYYKVELEDAFEKDLETLLKETNEIEA